MGIWINSPHAGTCCPCKPSVCDPCGGCGTPEDCYTEITPGDSVVHCEQIVCTATPPEFFGEIAVGAESISSGIVKICGTPSGCTVRIDFGNFGDLGTGNALGSRSISILVDGVSMTLTYEQSFEVNQWTGSTTVTLALGECIDIQYTLGSTGSLDGAWAISLTCIP